MFFILEDVVIEYVEDEVDELLELVADVDANVVLEEVIVVV